MYGKRPYGVGFLVIGQDVRLLICTWGGADEIGDWTPPLRVLTRWYRFRVLCSFHWS